jgi:flagellar motor component MotA
MQPWQLGLVVGCSLFVSLMISFLLESWIKNNHKKTTILIDECKDQYEEKIKKLNETLEKIRQQSYQEGIADAEAKNAELNAIYFQQGHEAARQELSEALKKLGITI